MSPKLQIFGILLVLWASVVHGYKDYKDFKIYNVIARTDVQQQQLLELSKESSYDFFNLARSLNVPARVLVPPQKVETFIQTLTQHDIHYSVVVDDVSAILAQERQENMRKNALTRLNAFERYYRHDEINAHLDALTREYPTRVFVKTFGRSYERRDLKIITITNGDGRSGKKVIFIEAGIHAREWITPAMVLHIINELLENYEENSELLRDYDWVILPVSNPDGYEYTHEEDRYWRKTRTPNDMDEECIGTDANRNFDFHWGLDEGSSDDPCQEIYRGHKAFSEPEARVVSDIMWHYKDRMKFYLSLHSYGNYILLPWGYTSEIPDNFFDMMDVADAGAMAIVRATGTTYTYGNTHEVIYATSGDSADYAAGAVNIPVSLAMELPAGGFSGFDPPARQIEDFVKETWIGIKAMGETVVEKF